MASWSPRPSISRRLTISYILDWILILCIVAFAGGISYIRPYHRPFSLMDLNISFPYEDSDLVSTPVLVVIGLIAPAVIIIIVTAIFVPPPSARGRISNKTFWKRKLWEWHVGWMGLGLSFALAFMFTSGMKNLFGKPRPDLLARCQPDLSNIAAHVVGGFGQSLDERWILVNSSICTQPDRDMLDEGFRSFPSGHSSMSWQGMLYLSLWLASKFNIRIPYLHSSVMYTTPADTQPTNPLRSVTALSRDTDGTARPASAPDTPSPYVSDSWRNRAAAPPVLHLILVMFPICVAIYVVSTRYVGFKHFGIDMFGGSVIGILSAWLGFRWYHASLNEQGWAWGARSRDRAFFAGSESWGWVGPEGKDSTRLRRAPTGEGRELRDIEAGVAPANDFDKTN